VAATGYTKLEGKLMVSHLIASAADLNESPAPEPESDKVEEPLVPGAESRAGERTTPLRLILHPTDAEQQSMTLPISTTAGDVREAVQYLRKKPTGVTVAEAMEDVKRRVFEPRKLAAYEFWGILARQGGNRLQLTPLGWEFARKLEPAAAAYRAVLDSVAPYRFVLEWMQRERLDLVTHTEVAAYWQELYTANLSQDKRTLEGNVVCFFHLCQAGELGTATIGKRGQPARLRIEREELDAFIAGRAPILKPPSASPGAERELVSRLAQTSDAAGAQRSGTAAGKMQFLILCSRRKLSDQLRVALEVAGIENRMFDHSETGELIASAEMLQAMRQCTAALIVVTAEDCCDDGALKRNILVQINTALVLYDRRVALLWGSRLPVPESVAAAMPHLIFEGEELTWDVGVRLMRVINEFQAAAQ